MPCQVFTQDRKKKGGEDRLVKFSVESTPSLHVLSDVRLQEESLRQVGEQVAIAVTSIVGERAPAEFLF